MAKVVVAQIKLQIVAGQASPAPPVGPALGQHNVPIMDFVRQFNDKTGKMEPGTVVPVIISVFKDRTFSFMLKSPPASYLLKKAAGIAKGWYPAFLRDAGTGKSDDISSFNNDLGDFFDEFLHRPYPRYLAIRQTPTSAN